MTDLRKAAEMALKYFEDAYGLEDTEVAIKEALRQALAQPPCQTGSQCIGGKCPECEREWVEITKGECDELFRAASDHIEYAWAIEAKLKEKNT